MRRITWEFSIRAADPLGGARRDCIASRRSAVGRRATLRPPCGMRSSAALCCRCSSHRVTSPRAKRRRPGPGPRSCASMSSSPIPRGRSSGTSRESSFEVREDGKPQRIRYFLVAGRSRVGLTPGPEAGPPEAGAPPGTTAPAGPGRHIVIVFDDLHVSDSSLPYTRDALRRFVREFTSADDTVALLEDQHGRRPAAAHARPRRPRAGRPVPDQPGRHGGAEPRGGDAECGRGRDGHAGPVRRNPARGEHADGGPGDRRRAAHGPPLGRRGSVLRRADRPRSRGGRSPP